jgi:hypothetical protein
LAQQILKGKVERQRNRDVENEGEFKRESWPWGEIIFEFASKVKWRRASKELFWGKWKIVELLKILRSGQLRMMILKRADSRKFPRMQIIALKLNINSTLLPLTTVG